MKKRVISLLLVICLLAGLLPTAALAADSGEKITVVGFEEPDGSVAEQTVPAGRNQDALIRDGLLYLPASLTAQILVPEEPQVEPGFGFDGPEIFDESAGSGDGGSTSATPDAAPEMVIKTVEIPVAWPKVIDGVTAGVFILEPILPEEYVPGEGVDVPAVTVTVEDMELDTDTETGKLLREFLDTWFSGVTLDGIPAAVLAMDEDALLGMIADYEQILAAAEEAGAGAAVMDALRAGIDGALAALPIEGPVWLHELPMMDTIMAGAVDLKYLDGDGTAFIYHSFEETKSFSPGQAYAFLNNQFDGDDAVSALGSGAILKATDEINNSVLFMHSKYPNAKVEVYVDVIQKGRDFDNCQHGGLYKVPGTSPAEYRYFCWAGGAQDCGAYYAYTYQTSEIEARDVRAQLKDVTKQGSNSSADYTVILTYDTGKTVTLDPGGYTVSADASTGVVTFKITDNDGKTINARFQGPAAIRYSDGGKSGVTGLPGTQYALPGSVTLAAAPTCAGYAFTEWRDQNGKAYANGATISDFKTSMTLTAQWRDTKAPDFTYEQVEVKLGATKEEVADKVRSALTVTDNEPAEECTVVVTVADGATNIAGERQVTVTVKDKAGNKTERQVNVTVTASALALTTPVFDKAAKTLTAQLASPGEDKITETGLVWGIMTAPTTALNNGKYNTTPAVTTAGGEIKTPPDITEGVTYYARAYAIAGGVTYYSEQVSFGIGAANYGTFNISSSGNTFTVTRTDGSDGTQTVYFRTVNGSAVGGTHFTHQAGTLTFGQGETKQTITVNENGVAAQYGDKPATAYSNTDRTYSVEIYRVTGGGTLGNTTRASRIMSKDSNHTVSRTVYTTEQSKVDVVQTSGTNGKYIGDSTRSQGATDKNVRFLTNRNNTQNYHTNSSLSTYYSGNTGTYLQATGSGWYYRYDLYAYEIEDGYEHAYIGNQPLDDSFHDTPSKGDAVSGLAGQLWACTFEQSTKGSERYYSFPDSRTGGAENSGYPLKANGQCYAYAGSGTSHNYVKLGIKDTCYLYFSADGQKEDEWYVDGLTSYAIVYDEREPQLIAIAPMPASTYKAGDQFVVSLIFDEIVDTTNTGNTNLNSIKVHTNWGDAEYTGGADTNVLYFTGTVKAGASGNLSITGVDNINLVKDMCNTNGTASSASSGMNTSSKVDGNQPNISVASNGVKDGVGKATVKVNDNKAYTTSMRYVWSNSATMPATGWVDATATELTAAKNGGLTLSTRQEPGSGNNGKWYLHVLASYETTGASAYQYAEVNFGTPEHPTNPTPPALSLAASADNTNWVTSRDITVTAANGDTLDYHREGDSGWKTMTSANGGIVTVAENGAYTFRLRRGDDMETKTVEVEHIDTKAPAASVGALSGEGSVATPREGVYTQIALPVTFSDAESGVAMVEYAWTNSTDSPGSWQTLEEIADGSATLTYTATENTETAKYLHIRVTDNVGRIYAAVSPVSYTVIAQSALDGNAPKIALSDVPAKWINDSVTLTWTVTNETGRRFKVTLPDDSVLEDVTSGTVQVTENCSVTVKVEDLDYGGISTATAVVDCIDVTPPTVNVPAISDAWTNGAPTVTFTADDTQSDVGKAYYKIVSDNTATPTDLTEFGGADYTVTLDETSTPTSGEYYVYYKFCDKSPSDWEESGRETNHTDGFAGPFKIDRDAPTVTVGTIEEGWYSAAPTISLTPSDVPAGVTSFEYAVTTTNSAPAPTALTPLDTTGGSVTVGETENGTFYIYYKAVDNAGNETTGWSDAIKVDKRDPTLTVSGGMTGDPTKTEQTLTVTSSFGVSLGTVTVKKPDGSTETVSGNTYTVTEAGTYEFTATSSSGLTATATVVIYAVSFDGNGAGSPATQLVASGGTASTPTAPTLAGHTFVEWDAVGGAKYGFTESVTADVKLTAKWTLDVPTVTLTADYATAVYNNGDPVITLTAAPSHAATDTVTYTYEWFKDGTAIAGASDSTYALRSTADNGTYTVKVTTHCGHTLTSETVTSDAVEASVTAAQPVISAPTVTPLTYGDELTDDRLAGGSASLNGVTVAGTFTWVERSYYPAATPGTNYGVIFTPDDEDNYLPVMFDVTVTVNKKTLTPSVEASLVPGGVYNGTKYSHPSADGEIVLAGAVRGEAPTAHGQVEFATKDAGENKPVNVTGIALDDHWGDNYELTATELTEAPSNADVTPQELTFVWHFSNAGDGATDATAGWNDIYYTGKSVTVTAEATNLVAGDECALTVGENGTRTNAGTYTAKVTEISNPNYQLPTDVTKDYTIQKAPVSFEVTDTEYTYDGAAYTATVTQNTTLTHTLTATASGGAVFTVTYDGAANQTNAGTYDIVVTLNDSANFVFTDGGSSKNAGTLTINRAPVTFAVGPEVKPVHDWETEPNDDPNPDGYVISEDADPAVWNDFALTMTYDSLEHRASVRQDNGVAMGDMFSVSYKRVKDAAGNEVTEDAGETFRAAGTYEIWVTLTDDPENFMFVGEQPDTRTLCIGAVTVEPCEVRVTWQNLTFVYHGHKMHPTVRVENAFLADEQPDEKEKQGFLKNPETFHEDLMAFAVTDSADAGDYTVTVTLYGSEAGNYTVSDPTADVVIQPAPVVFKVTNNEWLYHEEGPARDVTLTAAWGEVTNSPDTVLGDRYPGAGTSITLNDLGVTADDIEYRLEDGTVVDDPTETGTYQVWVQIPNANFRHAGSFGGGFHNVGVLRIAENDHPATYTVTFDPGRDEQGNRFAGVTAPEPMEGLIPTQEITLPAAPENAPNEYVFAGWSRGGALYQPGEEFYMPYSDVTFEAKWTKAVFSISGVVIDKAEDALPYVSVALMMGEHQIDLTTTDEDGFFSFSGLLPNTYNLVFTWNGVVKTYMVEITDESVENGKYTLPGYRLNTVVEVAPGSGSVVVDLDPIITDNDAAELYDNDERKLVEQDGGTVEFKMKIENSGADAGMAEKLEEVPVSANNIGMVLDMTLTKTVTGVTPEPEVTPINDSMVLIANLIYLPAELQGKDGYTVYRFHDTDGDGTDEVQTITTAANEYGEHIEVVKDGTAIMVYARYYSTYVLTWYQNPQMRGAIVVPATPHGTVTPDVQSAVPGYEVSLTVKPNEGCMLDSLTVTDSKGQEVPLTDNGDGTYSFVMPNSNVVTVHAAFHECPSLRFPDLDVTRWYHRFTDYVIARAVMNGYDTGLFVPEGNVTRAEMVTVLWNMADNAESDAEIRYTDVMGGAWYGEAIRWAAEAGVANGYGDGTFRPDRAITREEMAAMLYRYEKNVTKIAVEDDPSGELDFPDKETTHNWALDAMSWCAENGLFEGDDAGLLRPGDVAERAELAKILTAYMGLGEKS